MGLFALRKELKGFSHDITNKEDFTLIDLPKIPLKSLSAQSKVPSLQDKSFLIMYLFVKLDGNDVFKCVKTCHGTSVLKHQFSDVSELIPTTI